MYVKELASEDKRIRGEKIKIVVHAEWLHLIELRTEPPCDLGVLGESGNYAVEESEIENG